MHRLTHAFLASLAMFLAGISAAHETPSNNLRICVQLIEVPLPTLTEMMAGKQTDGTALHQQAMSLVKSGAAKLVDSNMVMTRSGKKATAESIREEIYPTEYSPPMMLGCGGGNGYTLEERAAAGASPSPASRSITAFDTRNTGLTFEVEPYLQTNGRDIDLKLSFENVALLRLENWGEHVDQWGDASRRMPIYESWRTNTALPLMAGKFELASVISSKPQASAPAVSRKLLLFVRVDVVRVLYSP